MSEKTGDTNHQALMKKALLELRELRSKVKLLENARHEPIAIVGMGCRFPGGADDPQAFWQRLQAGYDAITEVPAERWDVGAYYDPTPATPGKLYTRAGSFFPGRSVRSAVLWDFAPRSGQYGPPATVAVGGVLGSPGTGWVTRLRP